MSPLPGHNQEASKCMNGKKVIEVMIVDDHPVVRHGIKTMLSTFDDISVIGEAGSAAEALVRCQETRPHVILMDVVMPVMNGVETTHAILTIHPQVKIIILTSFPEQEMIQEALEAGAIGFLLKDVSIDTLGSAIRSAAAGQSVLSGQATQALFQKSADKQNWGTDLSIREREVLALVAEGLNNTEIAEQLVISPNTVRNHVSTCMSKLGASNRAQAAVLAMKNHLILEPRDNSYG